ncbi:MAG: hydroxyethylthiazole kinase [Brachybacterium sp.]|uniref:hydroxyethylthiazole kinase n=1 Tax=Brachybacterium sp. TaxID=1891286 RepID=UPI00264943C4|nr:hydroxyethylthiazole kinase [Brachybacterium sp.]MDN5685865.1 hydroxyethylthiazole kinase [Brachybacterium sp.]
MTASTPGIRLRHALEVLRERSPLVQCLTNTVVQQITADVLLAVRAAPAMVDHPQEAPVFAGAADGVLINVGTVSPDQATAMPAAARAASEAGTPWVLDPVAVGSLPVRTPLAHELLALGPTAIRGNASEISALAGDGAGGRGVDATDSVDDVLRAAGDLARRSGTVVAVSGERDAILSADRTTVLTSGDALLARVIGTGCSLGAVCAAVLGATRGSDLTAHDAVLAAHALLGAAGTVAAREARGVGSFAVAWLDALDTLTPEDIVTLVEIQEDPVGATA